MDSIVTVIEAAESYDLTTLETVKAELGVTGDTDDAYLSGQITRFSRRIASFCNRVFALERVSEEIVLGRELDKLMLSRVPVAGIVSVTVGGETLDGDGYKLDRAKGVLWRMCGGTPTRWTAGTVVVTYTAGWRLPGDPERDLPEDVEGACIDLVKRQWYGRARDPALRSVTVPDVVSEQYWGGENAPTTGGIPNDVAGALKVYRVPVLR